MIIIKEETPATGAILLREETTWGAPFPLSLFQLRTLLSQDGEGVSTTFGTYAQRILGAFNT